MNLRVFNRKLCTTIFSIPVTDRFKLFQLYIFVIKYNLLNGYTLLNKRYGYLKVVQCYDYVNTPVLNSQKEKQTDHKYIDLGPENKKVFLKYVSKKPKLIKLRSDGSFKKELYDYIVNKQQQYTEVKWDSEDL